ncbi:MAG: serine/threonine-protein kinase [Myxococcales bacterium]
MEAVIGEGGMGLVYRVTHAHLHKTLAIKVIRRENTRDQEVIARFRREAESASAIGNQHIVDVSDFGVLDDGSTYFVMECLHGMDLIDAMEIAQRMPEGRAIHIATQLCKALGAAHRAGIVHRDLKPENIFLTRRDDVDDFVKVLDFGIAKVANGCKRITRDGEVLGTPHYMSPEQCEGENVDHRTDIYALGVLLYEMITGQVPHDADTMMGILTKHLYEDPLPPKVRVPHISDELQRVIMRCLEKKPEHRYQTMSELEADLAALGASLQSSGPDTVTLTPAKRTPARRRRVSPVYAGGLLIALLVLAGALAWNVGRGPGTETTERGLELRQLSPATAGASIDADTDAAADEPNANEALASADEGRSHSRKARASKPTHRDKPKARAQPTQRHDTAILDPWE